MNNKEIGSRIKSRRQELNLTQGDVAAGVGLAISTVGRYEAGQIESVKLPVIEAIARVLRVSPDWLIGKSQEREPGTEPPLRYAAFTGSAASPDAMARNVARVRAMLTPMAQRVGERYDKADAGTQSAVRKLLDIDG